MISWGWLKDLFGTGKRDDYTERDGSGVSVVYEEPLEPDFLASNEEDKVEEKKIEPLDLMSVHFKASPNKSRRRGEVKYIVLHHTGAGSYGGIVKWLCNPQAKVSAHYVVGPKGELTQLVNTGKKAWHCGKSYWDGLNDINEYSVGIEICNIGVLDKHDDGFYYEYGRDLKKYTGSVEPKHGNIVLPDDTVLWGYYIPYSEKQIKKVVSLCKGIIQKYPNIVRENILTHYQIARPIGRKSDPFGWDIEAIKDMIFN